MENKDKIIKGFAIIVGVLTYSTLIVNYTTPTLVSTAILSLGFFGYRRLK